jgi:hypothetical protein
MELLIRREENCVGLCSNLRRDSPLFDMHPSGSGDWSCYELHALCFRRVLDSVMFLVLCIKGHLELELWVCEQVGSGCKLVLGRCPV